MMKQEILLRKKRASGQAGRILFSNAGMEDSTRTTTVLVPRSDWEGWEEPEEITVVILPGDRLNPIGGLLVVDRPDDSDDRKPLF